MRLSQPDMVKTVTQIRVLEVGVFSPERSAGNILTTCVMQGSSVLFPPEILVPQQKFASFLLGQLNERLCANETQLTLIQGLVVSIQQWAIDCTDPEVSFIKSGSIRSLCNLLRQLSSFKTFAQLKDDTREDSVDILNMVYKVAMAYNDLTQAAAEAIDHRLLLTLVRHRRIFLTGKIPKHWYCDERRTQLKLSASRILIPPDPKIPRYFLICGKVSCLRWSITPYDAIIGNPTDSEIGHSDKSFRACSGCGETYYLLLKTCKTKSNSDPLPLAIFHRSDYLFLRQMLFEMQRPPMFKYNQKREEMNETIEKARVPWINITLLPSTFNV
ncbi:hypothetical protein C8J56DRAFT_888748 [Mycena floridula]|nr:hypothetical protein C8J56DRAFT_888748 [Mycena floridula]